MNFGGTQFTTLRDLPQRITTMRTSLGTQGHLFLLSTSETGVMATTVYRLLGSLLPSSWGEGGLVLVAVRVKLSSALRSSLAWTLFWQPGEFLWTILDLLDYAKTFSRTRKPKWAEKHAEAPWVRLRMWTCGRTTGTWMNVRVVVGTSCTWLCVEPSEARVCSRPCVHVRASLHVDLYVKVCVGTCVRAGHERASVFVSVEDVCGYA